MASFLIRRDWFAWAGINIAGAPTATTPRTATGLTVTIPFTETLKQGPLLSQFTATVAAAGRTVTAVTTSGKNLILTLAGPTLTAGQAVIVTYTQGGVAATRLQDTNGDQVPTGAFPSITAT